MLGATARALVSRARAARIAAGPINRVDEVGADPFLLQRGLLY